MDRRFISIVLAALVAAGALAVGARQWQKSRRNGLVEANGGPAVSARKVESASPAAMVNAPATAAAASSPAGATTTPLAAGPSSPINPVSPIGTSPTGGSSIGGSGIEGTKSAGEKPGWKNYTSAEYGFEINYPASWTYIADFEGTKGKPPSGKAPAYAGETRSLFNLEMEGPKLDKEGGGDFSDGTIVRVKVTGTNAVHESWTMNRNDQWYLTTSTLEEWVKDQYSTFPDDNRLEYVSMGTNGFKGTVAVGHDDRHPEKIFGEAGGAYRILPSGRAVLVEWYRLNVDYDKANDFSYQNYLQPMLASFRLLSPSAKN